MSTVESRRITDDHRQREADLCVGHSSVRRRFMNTKKGRNGSTRVLNER